MDKKQIRLMMILPVMGVAALSGTRCAHAEEPDAAAMVYTTVLAAKVAYVVSYATPLGKDMDGKRYELARTLCYEPDNELEILRTAAKFMDTTPSMTPATAVGIAVVSWCNDKLFGRSM